MAQNIKKEKWLKFRHRVVRNILFATLGPYTRIRYRIKIDSFKEQNGRQYLILLNHTTPFDQFFVGLSFKGPIYYLATEDIFSKGFVSKIIKYLVAPIPIKKQTNDVAAVLNCLRVAREGGTLCIAPEGNRTYSGKTEYMNPTIAQLAKRLRLPIALYRIEGGYGAHPRWSDVVRKGKMHSFVSRVIEPEEYKAMTDDELNEAIREGLFVNEAKADTKFIHKRRAEYLERAVYVCPFCDLAEFESDKTRIRCKRCNRVVEYGETTELFGVGFEFPFKFVNDWYNYQQDFVNSLDLSKHYESAMFEDIANFSEVIVYKNKVLLKKNARVSLYGNRIVIDEGGSDERCFNFNEITAVSVLGRNKLNIYYDNRVYQLGGSTRLNSLKYVNIFYRYKNICKGDENEQFLGL